MLIILLDSREVDLIPLGLQAFLFNSRVPIQWLALLASSNLHWFGIHHLLVHHYVVELNSQLLASIEADICCLAVDHTCHIVHYLFDNSSACLNGKLLVDSTLHRISKRNLLGQHSVIACIIGDHKLSLHTAWCRESSHWHLKDALARDGVCLTFCQHISHCPFLIFRSRSRLFLYAQVERLIGIELKIYIIFFELIDEHAPKLLGHLATSRDSPIVAKHYASRAVQTKVECHGSIFLALVSYHEVELLVLRLHLGQVQSVPFLTCCNLHSTPVEVNCLLTCQVHNLTCLILLGRKHNLLCRRQLKIQITHVILQQLLHILTPEFVVSSRNRVVYCVESCVHAKTKNSPSSRTTHSHHCRLI